MDDEVSFEAHWDPIPEITFTMRNGLDRTIPDGTRVYVCGDARQPGTEIVIREMYDGVAYAYVEPLHEAIDTALESEPRSWSSVFKIDVVTPRGPEADGPDYVFEVPAVPRIGETMIVPARNGAEDFSSFEVADVVWDFVDNQVTIIVHLQDHGG